MTIPAKLPNANRAQIDDSKIVNYLLSLCHPIGSGKAHFFFSLGYTIKSLKESLLNLAVSGNISYYETNAFGTKYIVDGKVVSPFNREVNIRSVWIVDNNDLQPRLVTAYPLEAI
ncbi:MAG: hypothetical protein H3C43_00150 [Leptonema sp. (in: Bacteria)]|nr:hypothetical protein [Leptonema sp. (in: bacteria)]